MNSWGPYGKNDNFKCEVVPYEQLSNTFYDRNGQLHARHRLIQESQVGKPLTGTFGPIDVLAAVAKAGVPLIIFLNNEWLSRACGGFPNWCNLRWEIGRTQARKVDIAEPLATILPELGKAIHLQLLIQNKITKGPQRQRDTQISPFHIRSTVTNAVGEVFGQFITAGKGSIWLVPSTHDNARVLGLLSSRLAEMRDAAQLLGDRPTASIATALPSIGVPSQDTKDVASAKNVKDSTMEQPSEHVLDVFISHSSKDEKVASALISLLKASMHGSRPLRIRCTSITGYKLKGGAETDDALRIEMQAAKVFIGLITHESLRSTYVLFELGARWGAALTLIPLVASGMPKEELKKPISNLHAFSCDDEGDLRQLVDEISAELEFKMLKPNDYHNELKALLAASTAAASASVAAPVDLPKQNPGRQQVVEATQNLKCLGARVGPLSLQFENNKPKYFVENPQGDVHGFMATFRNEPLPIGTKPDEIKFIHASIVFRTLAVNGEKEIGHGNAAATWLNEYWNTVDFPIGESKTVVIAVLSGKELHTLWNRRRYLEHSSLSATDDGLEIIDIEATDLIAEVTLLTSHGEARYSATLELHCGGEAPEIKWLGRMSTV